jgi:hypothetical protein
MIGYVARDLDGTLWFHYQKPKRNNSGEWISDADRSFEIEDKDFPEFKSLTWKDKPLRVGFNIHKANIQD